MTTKMEVQARMSIDVPRELKEVIEFLKSEANWSQVACRAFEGEIRKIQADQKLSRIARGNSMQQRVNSSTVKTIKSSTGREK